MGCGSSKAAVQVPDSKVCGLPPGLSSCVEEGETALPLLYADARVDARR